jgi:hypothetical protein
MSKRKNTLNDLEEFLKLQASTLAPPQPVEPEQAPEPPKPAFDAPDMLPKEVNAPPIQASQPINLLAEMKKLAGQNKNGFYDSIVETIESMPNRTANDLLLINTALYLKHGDNWKQGMEEYWRAKKVNR